MKVEIELDDLNELKNHVERLESDLANQIYNGNSISYIHSKMVNYGNSACLAGIFIRKAVKDGRLNIDNADTEDYETL